MPAAAPKSAKYAMAHGYHLAGDLKDLKRGDFAFGLRVAPAVDCNTAAKDTLCFDDHYPDGTHVVGYCDGNGTCQLYSKAGG